MAWPEMQCPGPAVLWPRAALASLAKPCPGGRWWPGGGGVGARGGGGGRGFGSAGGRELAPCLATTALATTALATTTLNTTVLPTTALATPPLAIAATTSLFTLARLGLC